MGLVFKVSSYEYLKDLLLYLNDKGYAWVDEDKLSNMKFIEWLWQHFSQQKGLLIILDNDGVYYDDAIHRDNYERVFYYDTIEELDESQYIVPNQASTVHKKVKREYVIYAPDKLCLKGHSETSVLARNGDTYFIESVMAYNDSVLFTKTEAEQALKELNVNWGIAKVK